MALDSSIILAGRPAQINDPLETQARVLSLRQMLQQGQFDQERLRQQQFARTQAESAASRAQQFRGAIRPDAKFEDLAAIDVDAAKDYFAAKATNAKSARDTESAELKTYRDKLSLASQRMGSILQLPAEQRQQGYSVIRQDLIARGISGPDESPEQYPGDDYLKARIFEAMDADKQVEAKFKEVAESRSAAEHEARLPGMKADAQLKQDTAAGKAPVQPADKLRIDLQASTSAETRRHHRPLSIAAPSSGAGANSQMVEAVMQNPNLYDDLTPTQKGAIAPDLAKRGFSGFGRKLAESAIQTMAQTRSAIDGLNDLKQTLKDNEQYIGPISGLQALNPYSDAKKAEAKIAMVRQRVGKALEGGVLRKEDEEKYKKILATLSDTPSTAISKVDNLIATLENDNSRFIDEQKKAGRNVQTQKATHRFNPATGKIEVIK